MIEWAKEKFSNVDKKQLIGIGAGTLAIAVVISYFSLKKDKNAKIPTP